MWLNQRDKSMFKMIWSSAKLLLNTWILSAKASWRKEMKRRTMGMCDDGGGQDLSTGLEGGGSQESRGVNLCVRFYATKQKAAMKQDTVTWKMLKLKIAHQEKCYRILPHQSCCSTDVSPQLDSRGQCNTGAEILMNCFTTN